MKISVRVLTYFVFCTGFFLGFFIASFFQLKENENYTIQNPSRDLYDSSLAQMMHRDVKILCWVFTHPANHKVRAIHLKNTWGHKCEFIDSLKMKNVLYYYKSKGNKLLFMSSAEDPDLPEIVLIPGEDGRKHLWKKTQQVYQYVSWFRNNWWKWHETLYCRFTINI